MNAALIAGLFSLILGGFALIGLIMYVLAITNPKHWRK